MRLLTLKPESAAMVRRVKQIRARFPEWGGVVWILVKVAPKAHFTETPGPWGLIHPAIAPRPKFDPESLARWFRFEDDTNFSIIPEQAE